ncbi:MAG: VOC family protein [bacterium]|nr:VOC family protein [bacterium]
MKFLHVMIRVFDLETSLKFWVEQMGFHETWRREFHEGRFTLVFLQLGENETKLELTYNWDEPETYSQGRNFGHLALSVENIYQFCQRLQDQGIVINRPPRDGHMAFVKSPDGISIELLQEGEPLPPEEPWKSMQNQGTW